MGSEPVHKGSGVCRTVNGTDGPVWVYTPNPNPNLEFGQVRFGFGPMFRTGLFHHYLEIKAFEMELKVIEKHFQAEHGAYSPTASRTLDTRTQQQCCCFSARFPQDGCKYILEVQQRPLSDECGHLLWAAPPLYGSLRPTVTELSPTAKCVDIPLTSSSLGCAGRPTLVGCVSHRMLPSDVCCLVVGHPVVQDKFQP